MFDVKVINTDSKSYWNRTLREVLHVAEKEKKSKYATAYEERQASFTLICCTVDVVFGSEAEVF